MLSSLIIVALAAAWLVVLVPMFARRRQQVAHTTDSALAARVVRRGGARSAAGARRTDRVEEAFEMPDTDRDGVGMDERYDTEQDVDAEVEYDEDDQHRRVYSDDARAGRRYRPGRGGFDPEAAALAARTKYARRQRIVLAMLLTAVVTAVVAAMAWPVLWWAHVLVDLVLVGYLTYLRRQVRIEEDIRGRRLARLSGESEAESRSHDDAPETAEYVEEASDDDRADAREPSWADPAPRAVMVEVDDEDPMFDELDERTWRPYRRASGE